VRPYVNRAWLGDIRRTARGSDRVKAARSAPAGEALRQGRSVVLENHLSQAARGERRGCRG
jgi:hypothetical protein